MRTNKHASFARVKGSKMDIQTISRVATEAINGKSRYGLIFAAKTKCRLNKAEASAFNGEVEKVAIVKNGFIGRNYERCVNRHGDGDFVAEKPSGMHFVEPFGDILLQADRDANKFYLRVSFDKQTSTEIHYLVGGARASESEEAQIREILRAKTHASAKQAAHGVAPEDEVVVRSYGIENILMVKAWSVDEESAAWDKVLSILNA